MERPPVYQAGKFRHELTELEILVELLSREAGLNLDVLKPNPAFNPAIEDRYFLERFSEPYDPHYHALYTRFGDRITPIRDAEDAVRKLYEGKYVKEESCGFVLGDLVIHGTKKRDLDWEFIVNETVVLNPKATPVILELVRSRRRQI